MLALSIAAYLLTYFLASVSGPPWAEIVSVASLVLYGWAAWRLRPGAGDLARRIARALAWALLAALLGGIASWLLLLLLPYPRPLLGVEPGSKGLTFIVTLFSSLLVVVPLFILIRTLLWLDAAARKHLRWQLALSYLLVSTLVSTLVYLVIGLYLGVASLQVAPTLVAPTVAAERAALTVEPLLRAGVDAQELQAVLIGLRDGTARIPVSAGDEVADAGRQPQLNGLRRLAVLYPVDDGFRVVAAVPDAPADSLLASLSPVLAQAQAGECTSGRPAAGTLADTAACPLRDEAGQVLGLVLVETDYAQPGAQAGAALGRIIGITTTLLAAAVTSLFLGSIVVLLIAGGLGYWLARHVTRPIEQLAGAAGQIAAGDLEQRIVVQSVDELGQLGDDFNTMAARLAERERALLVEKERAEQLLQGNRRLVANVSHELRTPLTTLRGYLEALEQSHGAQLPGHDLQVIQGEVQRLTGLIDDLFTLARADEQRLPLSIAPVDVASTVRSLVATLAPLARREREIEVVAAVPLNVPPVLADQTRLEQVLLNLAQNALRYTPPGGIVAFESSVGVGTVTISVADTGVGIEQDELALIFERFYRGDASRARETGGAGLGLALVRELVVAMGGSVAVSSEVGRGSRFSITLPVA